MAFSYARRNPKQVLSEERCLDIISKATSGVLSLSGDDGYPYGLPISFAYSDGVIYFHGTPKGHKVDAFKNSPNCCFTIIETDQVVPEEYTTYFRSVMAFGKVRIISDLEDKRKGLFKLVEKYSADFLDGAGKEIESKLSGVGVYAIDVEFISGKEAIEFAEMLEHAAEYAK